jgi:methylamine dehydrogenase accessory protein MauD
MNAIIWVVSYVILWVLVLGLGFLLLGALRNLAVLRWRLDQFEVTMPGSRIPRNGLKPGNAAPDFTLPCVNGGALSLRSFAGRKVLLVFTQSGCEPCRRIAPELQRLHRRGVVQVLIVNRFTDEADQKCTGDFAVDIPVLRQQGFEVAKKYAVYASPFAFLIDERGMIVSRGLAASAEQIDFVLSAVDNSSDEQSAFQPRAKGQPA